KGFFPMIRSRHPSHNILRTGLPKMSFRSVIRLGSTTELMDTIANGGKRIEVNSVQSVKNASNKKLMKECFTENGVKTADWYVISTGNDGDYDFINPITNANKAYNGMEFPI